MSTQLKNYSTQFENWMVLRNYSGKTIKCYLCSLRQFWNFCEARRGDSGFSKADAPPILQQVGRSLPTNVLLFTPIQQKYPEKPCTCCSNLEEDLTPSQADKKLADWVVEVLNKKNKFLDKFIKTFTHFYDYMLNYFDGKWSNGMVEGINNRIKMIKRRAFGYDDFENFRRRVLVEFL